MKCEWKNCKRKSDITVYYNKKPYCYLCKKHFIEANKSLKIVKTRKIVRQETELVK